MGDNKEWHTIDYWQSKYEEAKDLAVFWKNKYENLQAEMDLQKAVAEEIKKWEDQKLKAIDAKIKEWDELEKNRPYFPLNYIMETRLIVTNEQMKEIEELLPKLYKEKYGECPLLYKEPLDHEEVYLYLRKNRSLIETAILEVVRDRKYAPGTSDDFIPSNYVE